MIDPERFGDYDEHLPVICWWRIDASNKSKFKGN